MVACTSSAPPYERPAVPLPARFDAAPAHSAGLAAGELAPWQDFFRDERLKRLISLALRNSRDLRIAALGVEQARAQVALREADRWPTVNAGVGASMQPTGRGSINRLYTAGVQVTAYEVDLFSRLRNLSDAAAAQVLASVEARRSLQISVVAQVAATHLAMLADDEQLRVARETLATRESTLKLVKLRFDNGASSALDLRQAESLLETARVVVAQATRQRALDDNAMALLLGQPVPADLPAAQPLAQGAGLPEVPVGLPAEVLAQRPDVRQAEQQLIAAHANIGAARAAYWPRITLTGSFGLASNALSDLFQAGNLAWSFVPQLLQPIFDAGRNRANVALAEVNREVAVAQYERAIQTAFREVADALAGRATLGEQLRAQQRVAEAEAARTALAELRYRNGAASFLDLLDAQRSLLAARQGVVQVQAQMALNTTALYKALGGGWQGEATPR